VAEFAWQETSPLSRVLVAGRHGESSNAAGVTLSELRGFQLVQVMARRGQAEAMAAAAASRFGAPAPTRPEAVIANDTILIWSGPDQFLALSARSTNAPDARQIFAGPASISDQSDGRALLRLAGPRARDLLAKVCSLDLHPASFPEGAAAATSIDHTGINLWRGADGEDGSPAFYLLVFSTFAESLWKTFLDSGAEYGVQVDAADAAAWLP
jgi:sarcosine oxidase subunit gamma